MSEPKITYTRQTASRHAMLQHLTACDDQFTPPLRDRVNLEAYVSKLKSHATTFEAWCGPVLAGLVAAYVNPDQRSVFVTNVSVMKPHLRGGIAQYLLTACMAEAVQRGCSTICLEVHRDNHAAISFYKKNGFAIQRKEGSDLTMTRPLNPERE